MCVCILLLNLFHYIQLQYKGVGLGKNLEHPIILLTLKGVAQKVLNTARPVAELGSW